MVKGCSKPTCFEDEGLIKVPTKSGLKPSAGLSSTCTYDIAGNSLDRNESLGRELSQSNDKLATNEQSITTFLSEVVQQKEEAIRTCNFKSMQR